MGILPGILPLGYVPETAAGLESRSMKTIKDELTLFNALRYEIRALGNLEIHNSEWDYVESIYHRKMDGISIVTILICIVDQAALLGIIRRLYNHGLPIITVRFLET